MSSEKFTAGRYVRQNTPAQREEEGFCDRVTVTEGTRPPSGLKHPTQGSVHRNTVTEYVPHDHNHAPYESAKARRAPQTSLAPDGDSVDLGLVTKQQHKMLTDKSRQGKKRVD